ncbi:hypothetical protein M8C21_030637, partial [Ambrosia artemisiifolia]
IERKKVRKIPKSKKDVFLSQNEEFTEISFNRYRSASCRSAPSIKLATNEAPRRGSVYQSSKELGRMSRINENETQGRKKIAVSRKKPAPFSLEIVESLCSSDEDNSSLGSFASSIKKENVSSRIPLNKSLSAKLEMPHSPTKTESESSKCTSPKTRFSPFRKMFDPFTKSKSHKSPLVSAVEEPNEATSVNKRNVTLRKSLLNDFSNTEGDSQSLKKDSCSSIASPSSSPAHLSGSLKLRNKNGVPYYEFSVRNPHDVWVAKKWNTGDELINSEAFTNSMLTEFVLYDLARQRQSVTQASDGLNPKEESNEVVDQAKVNAQSNTHTSNPWPVADLHPDLESAAIVLQERRTDSGYLTPTEVSVVIPSGNHGLPSDESQRVKPLLDRWRLGGGCDCGGWDMGCPLVVFGSPGLKSDDTGNKNHVEIFLKGTKEDAPALTMKLTEEGQYAVDFHAKLSSLQAFSICVAILHGTEASIAIGGDVNRQVLQCDSLRVFIEDEVKHLIDAVAEGEKIRSSKNLDEIPPTFVVNPPFSPMSRA